MNKVPDLLEPTFKESNHLSCIVLVEILSHFIASAVEQLVEGLSVEISCFVEFMELKITCRKLIFPSRRKHHFFPKSKELLVF